MYRFTVFNAIGIGFTLGYIISLLALYYGASDLQISIIYSVIFIANISLFVVPQLLGGKETTSIFRACWFIRACISAGYLLVPFIPGNQMKVIAVIIIYFLFLAVRSVGVGAVFVVQKAICPANITQEFAAKISYRFKAVLLFTGIFSYLILDKSGIPSQELAFMILIGIGVAGNFVSTYFLKKLPATGYVENRGFNGITDALRVINKNVYYKETLLFTMLITGQIICSSFIINYLKTVVGYSSGMILVITSTGFLFSVIASYFLSVTGDNVSYKALYFVSNFIIIALSMVWAGIELFYPHVHSMLVLYLILFSVTSFCLTLNGSILYRMQTVNIPENNSYLVSVIYQLSSVFASVAIVLLLNILLKYNFLDNFVFFHQYSSVFIVWTCLAVLACIITVKIKGTWQFAIKDEFYSLMPANILGIFRVYRTGLIKIPGARKLKMDSLMLTESPVARKLVIEWMQSPDTEQRARALRVLGSIPYPEAFNFVVQEAVNDSSPLQGRAITVLGLMGNKAAIEPLKRFISSPPSMAQAVAIKTLLRLGVDIEAVIIKKCYYAMDFNQYKLDILLGLSETGRRDLTMELVLSELENRPDVLWAQTLLLYAAQSFNIKETLVDIYSAEKSEDGGGLAYIIDEFNEVIGSVLDVKQLREIFSVSEYEKLYTLLSVDDYISILKYSYDRNSALGLLIILVRLVEENNTARQ